MNAQNGLVHANPSMMRRSLVAGLLLGIAAGGLMALRIMSGGESWQDRTLWLVMLSGFGGMLAGMASIPVLCWFKVPRGRVARA